MNDANLTQSRSQRLWQSARSLAGTLLLVGVAAMAVGWWQSRNVPSGLAPAFDAPVAAAFHVQPAATPEPPALPQLSLDQWRAAHPGRAVALHFWADWCPVCRAEAHSISRISRDWPVLTVAMQSGSPQKVGQVLAARRLDWAAVADPQGDLARRYGVSAVPALIVIDPQGRIRSASVGYTPELTMRLRLWWAQTAGP